MSQTAINQEMGIGLAGMLADTGLKDAISRFSEEASLGIPFGVVVAQGTAAKACELPDGSGDKLIGVALRSQAYAPGGNLNASNEIAPKGKVSVLRKGRVLVKVEEAVVIGDRLYVRYASGAGGTQLGACRKSSVVNETIDATAQGVFMSAADAAGLAVLEVDFTAKP